MQRSKQTFSENSAPRWVKIAGEDVDDLYRATKVTRQGVIVESFSGPSGVYTITGDLSESPTEISIAARMVRPSLDENEPPRRECAFEFLERHPNDRHVVGSRLSPERQPNVDKQS